MPKDNDFNFEDEKRQDTQFTETSEYDEVNIEQDNSGEEPWNARFNEENAQEYSRTARKQPKQEASPLARGILIAVCVALLIPFIFYFSVQSKKDDKLTKQQNESIVVAPVESSKSEESDKKDDESKKEESKDEEESSSESGSTRPVRSDESSDLAQRTRPAERPSERQRSSEVDDTPVAQQPEAPAPAEGNYTVQPGETWYRISVNHGVSLDALLAANGATEATVIHPGQVIVIP